MTFQGHLRTLATRALGSISAGEAEDIYVISFLIDNERDDRPGRIRHFPVRLVRGC